MLSKRPVHGSRYSRLYFLFSRNHFTPFENTTPQRRVLLFYPVPNNTIKYTRRTVCFPITINILPTMKALRYRSFISSSRVSAPTLIPRPSSLIPHPSSLVPRIPDANAAVKRSAHTQFAIDKKRVRSVALSSLARSEALSSPCLMAELNDGSRRKDTALHWSERRPYPWSFAAGPARGLITGARGTRDSTEESDMTDDGKLKFPAQRRRAPPCSTSELQLDELGEQEEKEGKSNGRRKSVCFRWTTISDQRVGTRAPHLMLLSP